MVDFGEQIVRDPRVCDGQPIMKGTRVPLKTVLASIADGDSTADLLRSFPSLTESHIRAAIAFAAASAVEDLPSTAASDAA